MKKDKNEFTLKEALLAMVEQYRLKPKLHKTRISGVWKELMGPTIADYTTEIKIRGRVLYVSIASASLRQELTYGKEKLRRLINEELGEDYLEEVVIR